MSSVKSRPWWSLRGILVLITVVLHGQNRYSLCRGSHNEGHRILEESADSGKKELAAALRDRLDHLRRVALSAYDNRPCSTTNFLRITEFQYGQSGNNLIEFTHGLWLASKLNRTLIVPPWMHPILNPFDTTVLQERFCYVTSISPGNDHTFEEIESEDSFFTFRVWKGRVNYRYRDQLPPLNEGTLRELSDHFVHVYTALWSSLPSYRVEMGVNLIASRLGGNFSYSSVHKRSFEGGCSKTLNEVTKVSDFSSADLPMHLPDWNDDRRLVHHPLCLMNYPFIKEVMNMHHRNDRMLFIAFDGLGDVSEYTDNGAVFSHSIFPSHVPRDKLFKENVMFLDLFVAMHGDFFVLNPRSTYSWEIYVIRVALGLQSSPVERIYPDGSERHLWVSWTSIIGNY